jgi:hypothetical protein
MGKSDDEMIRDLALALKDGYKVETEYGAVTLRHRAVGDLIVTSGSVVACDPVLIEEEPQPFEQRLEPRHYPVVLSIAAFPDGDQRVAYATLRVRESQPVRWGIARLVEGDTETEDDEYVWSYSVESGTGCFMDADVVRALLRQLDDEPAYAKMINQAISAAYVNTWGWANVSLEPEIASNIVAFSTGLGDGAYLTYLATTLTTSPFASQRTLR